MKYYNIALLKAYFEKGYSILSYPKYVLFLLGLDQVINKDNTKWVLIIGALGVLFCFFIGWLLFESKFVNAELEVTNRYNPLAFEIREKFIKNKNF